MDQIAEVLPAAALQDITCLHDEVLILGIRQSFSNLATPAGDGGPMDHPTKGVVFKVGPDVSIDAIKMGAVCFFPKFKAEEVQIGSKRFFTVNEKDIKLIEVIPDSEVVRLCENCY